MPFEWDSDIDPTDRDLNADNVQLVFDEAKDQLRSTLDTHTALTTKANALAGFVGALTTWLTAFIVTGHATAANLISLAAYLVLALIAFSMTIRALWSHKLYGDGYWPNLLFKKEFTDQQPTELRSRLIRRYAEWIADNDGQNKDMARSLKLAAKLFFIGCGIFIAGTLCSSFLTWFVGWVAAVCR